MKKLVVTAFVLSSAFVFAQARRHLKPGNWQITIRSEMQGAPFTPPPMTFNRCITPDQANDPKSLTKNERNQDCEMKDWKQTGNKLTWSMVCHKHGGTQTGTGEMEFSEDSYTGTSTVEMDNPRMGHIKMVQHMSGQRTGDCAK